MDTDADRPSTVESVWIVGHDGSEHSRHAALWATRHAPGRTDEVRLVTAWHVPADTYLPAHGAYIANLPDDLESAAATSVAELADALRASTPVPVTSAVAYGGGARSLLGSAPADGIIVVGARGRGGFARLLLGSTSTQVATHSSVPVVVVPADAPIDDVQRLLVAVDGSTNSLAAYEWALRFARPGAQVDSVHVRELPFFVADSVSVELTEDPTPDEVALRRSLHDLATTVGSEVTTTHHVVEGQVRQELRRRAADADLLVMGARGHGAISSAILGSVCTWLLHHLHIPMAVVPAVEDAPEDEGAEAD